jgi:hypothetical protein
MGNANNTACCIQKEKLPLEGVCCVEEKPTPRNSLKGETEADEKAIAIAKAYDGTAPLNGETAGGKLEPKASATVSPAAAPALPSPPSGTATPFSEKSFSSRRESREASGPSESLVAARAAYHAQKERSKKRTTASSMAGGQKSPIPAAANGNGYTGT